MRSLDGYMRGVNLGGWLSQGIFTEEHLNNFIVEEDVKRLASWGLDHLRLPVDFENIETDDGQINEEGYRHIADCISWCRKYNLNMVLDLHKTVGYIFDDAEYSADFFTDKTLQDRFIQIWDRLSSRFAKDSDIVMFELLNEVTSFDVINEWNEIGLRAVATIRKNAPTAKILFGGVGYSAVNGVKYLPEPVDENIVYNVHCYEPVVFTHQTASWIADMPADFHIAYPDSVEKYDEETQKMTGAKVGAFKDGHIKELGKDFFIHVFKEAAEVAEQRNVPLYCGEYGVIDQAPAEDTLRWYQDINAAFEHYGIGRCAWSYKKMDFGLGDEHYSSILDRLVKFF